MGARISSTEWKIMELVWRAPRTLMEMVSLLTKSESWSKSTVITMVRRLEAKGLLRYEQNGRTKTFFPTVTREDAVAEQTETFLSRAYNSSLGSLVSAMVDRNNLTQKDIDELYAILQRAQEAQK